MKAALGSNVIGDKIQFSFNELTEIFDLGKTDLGDFLKPNTKAKVKTSGYLIG